MLKNNEINGTEEIGLETPTPGLLEICQRDVSSLGESVFILIKKPSQ